MLILFFFSTNIIFFSQKPDNVLIGADGHCKLADFGLSAMGLINKQAREPGEETANAPSREETTNVRVSASAGVKVCFVLFCFVLFCFVLFCFVLFCFVCLFFRLFFFFFFFNIN